MTTKKRKKPSKIVLTAREEKFARLVAEGETKAEAYRRAYRDKKDKLISSSGLLAYAVSKKPKVEAHIQALKEKFVKAADFASTITVDRQAKLIERAIAATEESKDWNNYLKAIDMQSKLVGIYAPEKLVTNNLHLIKDVPTGDINV